MKNVFAHIGFLQLLAQFKQRSSSSGSVLTSWCKYMIHIQGTQVIEIFKGHWANAIFESVIYG